MTPGAGLALAARAALQVLLVAASSVTLAAYQQSGDPGRLGVAGVVGFCISWSWWANAHAAAHAGRAGRIWYAGGAAIGTVAGAALARAVVG